jgi:tetratricopeptide (TPR) repeat protein
LSLTLGLAAILAGCGIPLFPVPVIKFAPPTEVLPEKSEAPLVATALGPGQGGGRGALMAMRSGRVFGVTHARTGDELLSSLPSAELKWELFNAYVPPFKLRPLKAGSNHYYNFTITPDFERATALYLAGSAEEALVLLDRIMGDDKSHPALAWQASYLRVSVLIMMGRSDLAEIETRRTEKSELLAMGKNHASRALRAEVKYWSGDIEGALEDAAQVVRAFGTWRFPATFSTPPLDQVELARCTTAQARADIVLGLALLARGHTKAALPWLELANQTMNNVMFTARHPLTGLYFYPPEEVFWGRGMSLVALGTAILGLDPESKRAEETFDHAQEYFDALGFRAGRVLIETFKVQALISTGRYARAEGLARGAVALAETLGLLEYVWRLEGLRGRALLEQKRAEEADGALRKAQSVVDLMAGTMAADDQKVRFGVGKEGITLDLVRIDLAKNNIPQLFEDLERGRARSFVALLATRLVAAGRQQEIVSRIRALDREIQQERMKKNALSSREVIDAGRERVLLERRSDLVATLRGRDPDLADALAVSALRLEAVQKLLGASAAMVYTLPAQGQEQIQLLIITHSDATLKRLAVKPSDFRALLDAFNGTLTTGDAPAQRATLARLRQALEVDSWPSVGAVYFVPSGDTHFVPWGALDIGFPIAVLPTGGWIARSPLALSPTARAGVIGDPEFGGSLPQLPGARVEAVSVSRLYDTSALIGNAATESALRARVGAGVDVLHLATHALFDPVYPLQSSLILSDGRKAVPLSAEALFANPVAARLVILSACETGMGQVVSGDELLGLARSFYLGGALSVVSSLWPVEDRATQIFMEAFHEESRGRNYGQAWLKARDRVRARGYPPSAYGAFVLGGTLGPRPGNWDSP